MSRCNFAVELPAVPAVLPPLPGPPEMPQAPELPTLNGRPLPGVPVRLPPLPAVLPPIPGPPEMPAAPEMPSVAVLVGGIVVPSASIPGYVPPGVPVRLPPVPQILPPLPGFPAMPELTARACPLDVNP